MADVPAVCQVEDRLKQILEAWEPLAGHTVITDQSLDVAVEEDQWPAILIYTIAYEMDQSDEGWASNHIATIEFEVISGTQTVGTISRKNHATIAHIIAAIAADRSLGNLVEDTQENDVAPASPNGKDVGSASLQAFVRFKTPRGDWFTII